MQLQELLATNEVWAMVVLDHTSDVLVTSVALEEFSEVFSEPTTLPPQRTLGHVITLQATPHPVNSRPYRYSPL